MQALFYIGLFGTFFFVMSGITAGVARTTFQAQLDRQDQVEEIFQDIEYTINRVVLRGQLSLSGEEGLDFALPNMSWTADDIAIDPWSQPVQITRIDATDENPNGELIASFGAGEGAWADVSYFTFISGGPDREIQTEAPQNIREWQLLHSAGGAEDDIVRTFSTREPMMETWNAAAEVEKNIEEIITRTYRQRVEAFSPSDADADDTVVGLYTNCALLESSERGTYGCDGSELLQKLREDRPNYPTFSFNSQLIDECNQIHEYNKAVIAYNTALANPDEVEPIAGTVHNNITQPVRPVTEIIPNDADITVGECWRYDPNLQNLPDFPSMAGDYRGQCAGQVECSIPAERVGLSADLDRDPFREFGNTTIVYNDAQPDQVTVRRNLNMGGWRIIRNNTIQPE